MKIHEYQAKEIFASYGIPVPAGEVVTTASEAAAVARKIDGPVVVKAQVHVGGRGKAGGVKLVEKPSDVEGVADQILGMDIKGLTVKKVLVTTAVEIETEAYVGLLLDRASKRITYLVSAAGGVDIEEVAEKTPELIHKLTIDPVIGFRPFHARFLATKLYTDPAQVKAATGIIFNLYRAFMGTDSSLAEINPLVTLPTGEVLAIDAKLNADDNALFRQPKVEEMRDLDAETDAEILAREKGLSYVPLDGEIGCVVNGAGLAMATMDVIKYYGGEPANFLDIGGSSNPEKVVAALDIITSDPKVKGILFNIFGGITRCDDVANGIKAAFAKKKPTVPVVIRLTGTNEDIAKKILEAEGYHALTTMDEAVQAIIEESKGGAR